MTRRSSTFRQRDLTRNLKAVKAAGLTVARVLPDGTIEIATGTGQATIPAENSNTWDTL
jgi:hypothetical protein